MIRRVLVGVLLAVALLLASGAAYERVAGRRAAQQHPAPGQRLDVGGRSLHVHCTGAGPLTVLVETGSGSWSLDWRAAQASLSEHYRTCTYDRPGYGWSEPTSEPATFARIEGDLAQVISSIDDGGPLVLMGHSFGGLYARAYAGAHPDQIAGLVLLDARHEDATVDLPAGIVAQETAARRTNATARVLAHVGVVRLVGPSLHPTPPLPADQVDTYWAQVARPHFFTTLQSEIDAIAGIGDRLRGTRHPVPVVVVRHGTQDIFGEHPDAQAAERVWQRHQEDLAARADRGTLQVAEGAGHLIHLEQPGALLVAMAELESILGTAP